MTLDLVNYDVKVREAVKAFWGNRDAARQKQIESGNVDQGERAGVTAGKNMDGFIALILDIIRANFKSNMCIISTAACMPAPMIPRKGLVSSNRAISQFPNKSMGANLPAIGSFLIPVIAIRVFT
jgi:hypothetical protein